MGEYGFDLELKIKKIRHYLNPEIRYNQNILPRPFIIEIAGSPSSGKTTIARNLAIFFRRNNFRVFRPLEAPEAIQHIARDTPEYNIRTGLYSLLMLIDFSFGNQFDLVLLERGIFDPCYWMAYWRDKKFLTDSQLETIQDFFLLDFFAQKIDLALFVICDSTVAYTREVGSLEEGLVGPQSTVDEIRKHNKGYKKKFDELSSKFHNLRLVDTTTFNEKEAELHVREIVIETLDQCVSERRSGFSHRNPIVIEGI